MPVIGNPDDQVWNMILRQFDHIVPLEASIQQDQNEKGYVIMKKVFVIGGGTMGLDIAQVFARKGFEVTVRDINDQIIAASEARLNKGLDKLVAKGKLDEAGKLGAIFAAPKDLSDEALAAAETEEGWILGA